MVNPDGSTNVSCDGSTVRINPPAPAPAPDASGVEDAFVLRDQGEIDVDRIRRLLDDASLKRLAIEITPSPRHG